MDELLGDIRSGFPERRQGDIFRRSGDASDKTLNALKRHSDPAMLSNGGAPGLGRSFGGSLEDTTVRRSGRRKRVEVESSRERTGSSPPPLLLTTIDDRGEDQLRTKINEWMQMNEREQRRERELQMKLRKRSEEGGGSFTQRIIGLLNAASETSPPPPFAKNRLYHSTRETRSRREEETPEVTSKDDSAIGDPQAPSPSGSDDSKCNFDRFASTRKTLRRIKLREMRIEAEKGVKIPKPEELAESSPASDVPTETVATPPDSKPESPTTESSDSSKEMPLINGAADQTAPTAFNRPRNTSLRSRQSRLARRIDSLSTPVTSPEISETGETRTIELNGSETTNIIKTHADNDTDKTPTPSSKEELPEEKEPKPHNGHAQLNNQPKNETEPTNAESDPIIEPKASETKGTNKTPKLNGHIKVTVSTETKSKVLPKSYLQSKKSAVPPSKTRTPAPKVTSIPSVIKTTQNVKVHQTIQRQSSLANGRPPLQRTETNGTRSSTGKGKSSESTTPTVPKTQSESIRAQRPLTNGRGGSFRNGKASPSSSISSLCSVSTNVKLVKNEKLVNGKSMNNPNVKKITINHNGSVKFTKGMNGNCASNKVSPKPLSNLNGVSRIDKGTPVTKKKAFV